MNYWSNILIIIIFICRILSKDNIIIIKVNTNGILKILHSTFKEKPNVFVNNIEVELLENNEIQVNSITDSIKLVWAYLCKIVKICLMDFQI